jgi:hypothetical protein
MSSAASIIAALDNALAASGEDIILRRRVGEKPNVTYVSVTCRARVDGLDTPQAPAGIRLSEFTIIMSPTQINEAQWPGGTIPVPPPFDLDPRIPRMNDTDEVFIRGQAPRVITFSDPKIIGGELVRLNLRCVA